VKFALDVPAATVTDAGTEAAALLLESIATTPPEPAGAVRTTVQVVVAPGAIVPGLQVTFERFTTCG